MQAIGPATVVGPALATTPAALAATQSQHPPRASAMLTILQRQRKWRALLWSRRPRRCIGATTAGHVIQTAAIALPAARSMQSHEKKKAVMGLFS